MGDNNSEKLPFKNDLGYFKQIVRHFDELSNSESPLYNEEECDQANDELAELVTEHSSMLITSLSLQHNGRSAKLMVHWSPSNESNNNEITIMNVSMLADGLSVDITEDDPETASLFRLARYEANRIFESM